MSLDLDRTTTGRASPRAPGAVVAARDLQGRWLTGPGAFEQLAEDWRRLAAASTRPALCSGLAWATAWWETFAGSPGDLLSVYACRHDAEVIGIAAFVTSRRRVRACSPFAFRALHVLGTGERDEDDVAAEYGDVLVASGYEAAFTERLSEALLDGTGPAWDVAFVYNQLDGALWIDRMLPALRGRDCDATVEPCGLRYVLALPDGWDAYLRTLGGAFRAKLRTDRRRLARMGTLAVETLSGPDAARSGLARLAALHAARWREKGQAGIFGSTAVAGFHGRLLESGVGPEHGEILVATLDGRDLAAIYTLRVGRTVHFYQSGFDSSLAPNVSLGAFVLGLAIERAIESGASEFDLMKGRPRSYKARYGGLEIPMVHATVFAPTLHGRFARRFAAAVDLFRTMRRAVIGRTPTAARSSSRPPASGAA
jgi:CelD/BcsL family acetyltransferase involved in cellulose biosynthesis